MPASNLRWKAKKQTVGAIQYCSLFSLISVKTVLLTLMMLCFRDLLSLLIVLVSAKETLMFEQQQSFQCDSRGVPDEIVKFTAS